MKKLLGIVAIIAAVAAAAVYVLKAMPQVATITEDFEVGDE